MLNMLEISNFRAFGKKVSIRIKPITLFIGRNNTGKSSAIEFLRQKTPDKNYFLSPPREGFIADAAAQPAEDLHIDQPPTGDIENDRREFINKHAAAILNISDIEFETEGDRIITKAKNNQTNTTHDIADLGAGVRQCLPIIVQGAMLPPDSTLIAEEPEARIHPTAQLALGSYFADLWTRREVRSIIETHSGNILLRMQRLVSEAKLAPADVSIAFFDIEDGKIVVNNLGIDNKGSLRKDESSQKGLPMEFFYEDVFEAMSIGASPNGK